MYVTSPTQYCVVYAEPLAVVPLWLPGSSVAIDVDDPFYERRLEGSPHKSAIYHVRLPDSLVLPPRNIDSVANLPYYFTQTGNTVMSEYDPNAMVPIGPNYRQPGRGKVYLQMESNGVQCVLQISAARFWQGSSIQGSIVAYLYAAIEYQEGTKQVALWRQATPQCSWTWDEAGLISGTLSEIEEFVRTKYLTITPTFIRSAWQTVQTVPKPWTEQDIRKYIAQVVDRNSRFSMLDLVRSCYGKEKVSSVLKLRKHTRYKRTYTHTWRRLWKISQWHYRGKLFTAYRPTRFRKRIWHEQIIRKVHYTYAYDWRLIRPNPSAAFNPCDIGLLKGKQAAYLDALEDIPIAAKNNLQNITTAWQVLTHFAFDAERTADVFNQLAKTQSALPVPRVERSAIKKEFEVVFEGIPHHSASAWLGGRYILSTTVMDAGEAWDYFYDTIQKELGTRSRGYKCHGTASVENATFSCTFHISPNEMYGKVSSYFEHCYRLGIEPNAYVMWDLIPFTFVLDWFIPIGDALDAYTKASHYSPLYYNYDSKYGSGRYSLCYSIKYAIATDIGEINYYCRWYERQPPEVDTTFILLDNPITPSEKTECWRCVDALALIF